MQKRLMNGTGRKTSLSGDWLSRCYFERLSDPRTVYGGDDDGLIGWAGASTMITVRGLRKTKRCLGALGFNSDTIAWCLIGGAGGSKSSFTKNQYYSALVVAYWKLIVPALEVVGHGGYRTRIKPARSLT